MSLAVGDPFPTLPAQSPQGPVDLAERWKDGPLVVQFHRLWCPFCVEVVRELEGQRDALRAAGGDAVVIYRQDADTVAGKCADRGVGFDCLSDPDCELEHAARIKRFKLARYAKFSPRRLVRGIKRGGPPGLIKTDIPQGRATYVVGRDGRITYTHVSTSAADIPPVAELLEAVRAAA